MDKILTIVLSGKNDNYGGNFLRYLIISIESVALSIKDTKYEDRVEILLVDWGSEKKLEKELYCLSDTAKKILNILYIPRSVTEKYNFKDTGFHVTISFNVGIRNANGKFVAVGTAKNIFTKPIMLNLLNFLEDDTEDFDKTKTWMPIERFNIPYNNFSIDQLLKIIKNSGRMFEKDAPSFGGIGFYLASKKIFEDLRGFDERMGGNGYSDLEFEHRVDMKYNTVYLNYYGIFVFNCLQKLGMAKEKSRILNKQYYEDKLYVNDENWGLAKYDFKINKLEKNNFSKKNHFNTIALNNIDIWIKSIEEYESKNYSIYEKLCGKQTFFLYVILNYFKRYDLYIYGLKTLDDLWILFPISIYSQLSNIYLIPDYSSSLFKYSLGDLEFFVGMQAKIKGILKVKKEIDKSENSILIEYEADNIKVICDDKKYIVNNDMANNLKDDVLKDIKSEIKKILSLNNTELAFGYKNLFDSKKVLIYGYGVTAKIMLLFFDKYFPDIELFIYDDNNPNYQNKNILNEYYDIVYITITNEEVAKSIKENKKFNSINIFHINRYIRDFFRILNFEIIDIGAKRV